MPYILEAQFLLTLLLFENFHFITRAETYELRENIITVRT